MNRLEIQEKARNYLRRENNPDFRQEIERLLSTDDMNELSDRFYRDLEFGTGGLRGVIGGGYNRMNPFVVRRATQGLATYVLKNSAVKEKSAVIAYDSRNFSSLFAKEAALVFAANGIKAFVFSTIHPTPILSYAVRSLRASVGIVVTASHNPPEYNGYKVYWSDGGQVIAPHDTGIISEVLKVTDEIRTMPETEAVRNGLLEYIDREIDDPYTAMVKGQIKRPELVRKFGKDLRVVYTPLHGTGTIFIERILSEIGIQVVTVPEQREPDGNFPTVKYPNPEEGEALRLALDLGRKIKADLVMGTDPDADRLGIAVPNGEDFVLITGNQLGALLADYIFSTLEENGKLPEKPAFVKTIVTSEFQRKIAESYGVACFDVLTGFKYIAGMIREFEESSGYSYIFGGEESYGYLTTTEVRDKDAVSAAVLTAEMTLYLRSKGKSVLDRLHELHFKHGWYRETLVSKGFKGERGLSLMKSLMDGLRASPPRTFGGVSVVSVKDYSDGTTLNLRTGSKTKNISLPSSNVLQFILENESVVSVRPSGTEPKVKFYISCKTGIGLSANEADRVLAAQTEKLLSDIESFFTAP